MVECPFTKIHKLLRSGQPGKALAGLLDSSTGRIRTPYIADRNHAWYCVGNAKFMRGDYRAAVKAYRRALANDKTDTQALIAIANCYERLARPVSAVRVLRRALLQATDQRDRASVEYNLGNAYFDLGRWSEAAWYFSLVADRRDKIGVFARRNARVVSERLRSLQVPS